MGNTEWQFSFRQRSRPGSLDDLATDLASRADSLPRNASSVVLFSGGLDSTSGLGTLKHAVDHTLLVSYYAANLRRQQNIAASLGFTKLVQVSAPWQDEHARAGGQFSYRAFFYLALAAVIADSMRVPSITQFENGPLALAVPPSRIYRMTRHAHPLMHMEAENFFKKVLGQAFVVENPFYLSTKREAVQRLAATVADTDKFKSIVRMTETCWYLKSMTIVGKVKKRVSQPCGVCIPCIVRRTALGSEDDTYAIDLLSMSRNARDPVVRVHLDAYLDYSAHILDRTMSSGAFLDDVPDVTARALAVGRLQAPQVFDLYRRFAKELRTTFSP
jgi:7-cyano-7-deazaguanine synthase in queuosine biosynthesis